MTTQPGPGHTSQEHQTSWVTRVPVRLGAMVLALAGAFHYSLGALLRDWHYQTPLADLAIVPLLVVGLLVVASRRHSIVGATQLSSLDLVLAVACLLVAATVMVVGPILLANYFWAVRPDLLSLPLAAVAAIAVLFGARAIVALAFPISFLFLAWPLPFTILLEHGINWVAALTTSAVATIVKALPVAVVAPGGPDLRLLIPHRGKDFLVSLASACSGTESLVGFGVVSVAVMYLFRGPLQRRLAWLALGAVAVWLGNLARIFVILSIGRWFGPRMAIGVLHPVAGILVLNLVFAGLLLVARRFGLSWNLGRVRGPADTPLAVPAPVDQRPTSRMVTVRLLALGVAAGGLAVVNGQLDGAAAGFANSERPASTTFIARPTAGPLWQVTPLRELDWSRPYFGQGSRWVRYRLRPGLGASIHGQVTMWADAIVVDDLGALAAHPVRTCYGLHRLAVLVDQRVTMARGIIGEQIVYETPEGSSWHVLTWDWPVRSTARGVVHERMVLLASTTAPLNPPARMTLQDRGISQSFLAVLNALAPDHDPNTSLSATMLAAADQMISARLAETPVASPSGPDSTGRS
jgi:exosortase/archaeosortase family protein